MSLWGRIKSAFGSKEEDLKKNDQNPHSRDDILPSKEKMNKAQMEFVELDEQFRRNQMESVALHKNSDAPVNSSDSEMPEEAEAKCESDTPKTHKFEFTPSQKRALEQLEHNGNFFITGGAGTGKTFLLEHYAHEHEGKVLVTAPTGVAAIRAGGVTLHRAFQIPVQLLTEADNDESKWIMTKEHARKWKRFNLLALKTAKILIIDEVSMCRADVFSYVMFAVNCIRKGGYDYVYKKRVPGHRIKVVLCGDFFQLPPVIAPNTRKVWKELHPDNPYGWAFLTEAWKKEKIKVIELKEIIRQKDLDFAAALNQIRIGNLEGLDYINQFNSKEIQSGPSVCPTNARAAQINKIHFDEIQGPIHTFEVVRNGDTEKASLPCEPVLNLKVGTKVIFLVNDRSEYNFYQNGSFGTVIGFDKKETEFGEEDIVIVRVEQNGVKVEVEKYSWPIIRYQIAHKESVPGTGIRTSAKLEKNYAGYFSQFPLRLGWAATVHKSQGQTYNCCNIIDPQRFWDDGQLYVALSRAESINKLHIDKVLTPQMIHTSPEVKAFYRHIVIKD